MSLNRQDEADVDSLVSNPNAPCTAAARDTPESGPRYLERPRAAADDTPQHVEMLCTSPAFQRHAAECTSGQHSEQQQRGDIERITARLRVYEVSHHSSHDLLLCAWLMSPYARGGSCGL